MHGNPGTDQRGYGLMKRRRITAQIFAKGQPRPQAHDRHAVPAQIPAQQNDIPRTHGGRADLQIMRHRSHPGGIDINTIALSPFHHLRIPCDDTNARQTGSLSHGAYHSVQDIQGKPLLQNEPRRQVQRFRAAHGQIIHRPVNGQGADIAAGKLQGLHHEAIRCHRQTPCRKRQHGGIILHAAGRRTESLQKHGADQVIHQAATAAVSHLDAVGNGFWNRTLKHKK